MKTIAEQKMFEDIARYLEAHQYLGWAEHIRNLIKERQSLSQAIAEDVAGCRKQFGGYGEFPYKNRLCRSLPPEQKCGLCKGKLEIKEWLEGRRLLSPSGSNRLLKFKKEL